MCFTANQFAMKLKVLANLITYFVSICNTYEGKLLSNSVKWSMRPFPKEGEGENYK